LSGGQANTTVARMLLGRQLRRFREAADVTPEQAGHEIRASPSKISRMENGRVGFKARDVADLLTCTASPANRCGLVGEIEGRHGARHLRAATTCLQPNVS
jgi:helix-turn-helix protein